MARKSLVIASYIHDKPDRRGALLQEPDPRPGRYYVTVRDGKQVGYLLGPFARHVDALVCVDTARKLAIAGDPKAHFYGFGTARLADDVAEADAPVGVFNEALGDEEVRLL